MFFVVVVGGGGGDGGVLIAFVNITVIIMSTIITQFINSHNLDVFFVIILMPKEVFQICSNTYFKYYHLLFC